VRSYALQGDSAMVARFNIAPATEGASEAGRPAFVITDVAAGHRYHFDAGGTQRPASGTAPRRFQARRVLEMMRPGSVVEPVPAAHGAGRLTLSEAMGGGRVPEHLAASVRELRAPGANPAAVHSDVQLVVDRIAGPGAVTEHARPLTPPEPSAVAEHGGAPRGAPQLEGAWARLVPEMGQPPRVEGGAPVPRQEAYLPAAGAEPGTPVTPGVAFATSAGAPWHSPLRDLKALGGNGAVPDLQGVPPEALDAHQTLGLLRGEGETHLTRQGAVRVSPLEGARSAAGSRPLNLHILRMQTSGFRLRTGLLSEQTGAVHEGWVEEVLRGVAGVPVLEGSRVRPAGEAFGRELRLELADAHGVPLADRVGAPHSAGGGFQVSGGPEGVLHFSSDAEFQFRTLALPGSGWALRFDTPAGLGDPVRLASPEGEPVAAGHGVELVRDGEAELTVRGPVGQVGTSVTQSWRITPVGMVRDVSLTGENLDALGGLSIREHYTPAGTVSERVLVDGLGRGEAHFEHVAVFPELARRLGAGGFALRDKATGSVIHFDSAGHAVDASGTAVPGHELAARAEIQPEGLDLVRTESDGAGSVPLALPPRATTPAAQVLIASNRGPVSYSRSQDGALTVKRGSGGLVSGLSTIDPEAGAVWVCAAMSDTDREVTRGRTYLDREVTGGQLVRMLDIDAATYGDAYNGIANSKLWFIHHRLYETPPVFDQKFRAQWTSYEAYNAAFADALAAEAAPGAAVLVQDYHQVLTPGLLRERRPDLRIGHFSHTPWAPPDDYRLLPEDIAERVLRGILGADRAAFLTHRWARAFADCCAEVLGANVQEGAELTVTLEGRTTRLGVHGLGVDGEVMRERSRRPDVEQSLNEWREQIGEGRKVIVRVDRIDLSKNIVRGLTAYQQLLQKNTEWRNRVVHIGVAVPSRSEVEANSKYTKEVERIAADINSKFQTDTWKPLILHFKEDLACALAAYRLADVALVNPIKDGMNLVAKEVPVVSDEGCALVLSREAGAAVELGNDAIMIDPFDIEETVHALLEGLTMSTTERAVRTKRLEAAATALSPTQWFLDQLEAL
jgi:trehalose 6-phosphate synthase